MPIRWIKGTAPVNDTHQGLVLSPERFSSSVASRIECEVWDPINSRPLTCLLRSAETDLQGYATVDAPPDVMKAWEDYKAHIATADLTQNFTEEEKFAEEAARDKVLEIKLGSEVVVVGGNKVPRGTRGKCIGVYDGNFGGKRVGVQDSAGVKHYTSKANCQGVVPGCHVDYVPPGGWRAYLASLPPEVVVMCPRKGDKVRRLSDGLEGKVFWAKGERLGFKGLGGTDAIWANAQEVVILDKKGDVKTPPPVHQEDEPPREPLKVNPLAHLPVPYCDIRGIIPPGEWNPSWSAIDERGEFLMNLTEAGAAKIRALVADQE